MDSYLAYVQFGHKAEIGICLVASAEDNKPDSTKKKNSFSLEESCNQTPMPCPLEKGKMYTIDPDPPSPLPAPLEPPIELVSPAVTSVALQGMLARAPWGPLPGVVGQTGKTGKAKKGASFADVAAPRPLRSPVGPSYHISSQRSHPTFSPLPLLS